MSATVNASFTLTPSLSLEGEGVAISSSYTSPLLLRRSVGPDPVAGAPSPLEGEGWGEGETGSSDGKASACPLG